jgi:hypothetical protein
VVEFASILKLVDVRTHIAAQKNMGCKRGNINVSIHNLLQYTQLDESCHSPTNGHTRTHSAISCVRSLNTHLGKKEISLAKNDLQEYGQLVELYLIAVKWPARVLTNVEVT